MDRIQHVVLVAGPSGGGKTASVERIVSLRPQIKRVVTSTTRSIRPKEVNGVDYHFYSAEQFEEGVRAGRFIETDGKTRRYGTEWKALTDIWDQERVPIAAITLPGVAVIREMYPHALTIFIRPMEVLELEGRIRKRSPEMSKDELQERLVLANDELLLAHRNCSNIFVAPDGKLESVIKRMLYLIDGYLADPDFGEI